MKRLFVACIANGSLEMIDLDAGKRIGTIELPGPQRVAVAGCFVYATTGGDGKLRRFPTLAPTSVSSREVGDDADNVRVAPDGKMIWVSFGGEGPGGVARFDGETMLPNLKFGLPRMPEGFQLHPTGDAIYANVPAGKRSAADGAVFGLKRSTGELLWERRLTGRAGNFPMTLDAANDRLFIVARKPAVLISPSTRDGSILGETPCALPSRMICSSMHVRDWSP
jgi:hypothetical protein